MKDHFGNNIKSLFKLAIVNSGLWALAIIALVFVIQDSPGAKGLFTILAGGSVVATILFSSLFRLH
jgi:uncharacterized membrane protein YpjA